MKKIIYWVETFDCFYSFDSKELRDQFFKEHIEHLDKPFETFETELDQKGDYSIHTRI